MDVDPVHEWARDAGQVALDGEGFAGAGPAGIPEVATGNTPALPFCHVRLKGQKPPAGGYPTELRTIGDHIRKRRLDLGLRQKDLAELLGVNVNTVTNWELGRSQPVLPAIPRLIQFLGHSPFPKPKSFSERLKGYPRLHGLKP